MTVYLPDVDLSDGPDGTLVVHYHGTLVGYLVPAGTGKWVAFDADDNVRFATKDAATMAGALLAEGHGR